MPTEDEIRFILNTDPTWSAYAIGDLMPDYAAYSRWSIGGGTNGKGLTLLFSRLSPSALFAMGDPKGVAMAIVGSELPKEVYLLLRREHLEVVSRYYTLPQANTRQMHRMVLVSETMPAETEGLPVGFKIDALSLHDADRVSKLYAQGGPYAPDAFAPYQVADGTYFGVVDAQGEVLASGGTHVVDWKTGVAAIGNLYTHPQYRGRGFGQAILRAVLHALLEGGVHLIVLNVDERNLTAKRLYERNGFRVHCPYIEGIAYRK
jgi:ribosomal protein S18 acetylase RimI-like enzyme